ncbi:MAG: PIN domain-containing protein [Rubrobacter sp.]|jgi:predicted nucleic acid-binding protein|nr:PIN domain-containing protein [Rubrobacter sp.]MDQ3361856.1 PIN domain-containing protein [Actinomycetota bacterium]MDQ3375462.1 PIN domain-containing protein [Actinomycetota bacterium]
MSAESFIDTNLFIYQLEALDERKSEISDRIIREGIETQSACISFQVVQECLNTTLRKAEIPLSTDETKHYLDNVLAPLFRVSARLSLYNRALDVQARYRYGFYDSLIVAAALDAGCNRLYSEDLQDGQRIEGLTIENPFKG